MAIVARDQAVDDAVPHAVVRQDLAGLESHFALVDIELELAHAEAVVGARHRLGDCGTAAFGNPNGRVTEDLEQLGLFVDVGHDPIHGNFAPEVCPDGLIVVVVRVPDFTFIQKADQSLVRRVHGGVLSLAAGAGDYPAPSS